MKSPNFIHSPVSLFDNPQLIYKSDSCLPLKQAQKSGEVKLHSLARGNYPGNRLPKSILPGLCTVGFWDAPKTQSWGLDWHRNEGIEFVLLERGRCSFATGSITHELTAGDFTITRPWQPHKLGNPNIQASRLAWIIIDVNVRRPNENWNWPDWINLAPADLKKLTDILRGNETPVLHSTAAIRKSFSDIMNLLENDKQPHIHSHLAVKLNEVLLLTLEMLEKQTLPLNTKLTSSERTVSLFLDELTRQPAQQARPWSIDLMAEQCGLRAHRFSQLVKEQTNLAPASFLNNCRMETAKKLLKETSLPASDISKQCGFATSQYFSLSFKKLTGMTPLEWREKSNRKLMT